MHEPKTGTEVALLFTGGLDTTLAASSLAEQYGRVHLLTFYNGCCIRLKSCTRRVRELSEKFRQTQFIHEIICVDRLFASIRKGAGAYFKKHRSPLVFDVCCRLAMETTTISYCLEHHIAHAAEASVPTPDAMFLWQPDYIKQVDSFFGEYGIRLTHPNSQSKSRTERSQQLKRLGLHGGLRWLEKLGVTAHLFNQPFCLWNPIAFPFCTKLRGIPFIKRYDLNLEAALKIRRDREHIARQYIREHHNHIGQNPPVVSERET